MKSPRHNKVLGIAVGERSMLVAEVHAASGSPQVVKTGEFRYPDGVGLKDPAALGAALAQFLKDGPFNSWPMSGCPPNGSSPSTRTFRPLTSS
jgi:hypothetical protein